jgi:hypothetical protein
VVRKLAERLDPRDLLSIVAFDDHVHVLAQGLSPSNLDGLAEAIRRLTVVGGGGTALGQALEAARQIILSSAGPPEVGHGRPDAGDSSELPPANSYLRDGRVRKLVLLTDGEDPEPARALAAARSLGAELRLPITAFGVGECKVSFLTQIAKTTLAGGFNHIRHEADAEQLFHQVLTGHKNVQATGVSLKLWLAPDVQVRELYRTRPEILFVGSLQPGPDNAVTLNLEQLERGKGYQFLLRCTLPRRGANQRLRVAKVTMTFDLPGLGRYQEVLQTNIIVEFSADPLRQAERSGDVRRVLARAEVQRQVLFLQTKADALKLGRGGDRDKVIVANLLKALIAKFAEFGDQAMANHYRAMEDEFERNGVISQEMLNRSLAASSRADEIILAQDIDF